MNSLSTILIYADAAGLIALVNRRDALFGAQKLDPQWISSFVPIVGSGIRWAAEPHQNRLHLYMAVHLHLLVNLPHVKFDCVYADVQCRRCCCVNVTVNE